MNTHYIIEAIVTSRTGKMARSSALRWTGENWSDTSDWTYDDQADALAEFEAALANAKTADWAMQSVTVTLTQSQPVFDADGDLADWTDTLLTEGQV